MTREMLHRVAMCSGRSVDDKLEPTRRRETEQLDKPLTGQRDQRIRCPRDLDWRKYME